MRMLTGQTRPTSGTIEVLGFDIRTRSKQARAHMGVVPQLDNLDTELTVEQNLMMFAVLYRIPRRDRTAAVERAIDVAQLRDRRTAKVTELSGGMKRRLLIATKPSDCMVLLIRRALPVVLRSPIRSRSAAVLIASMSRTARFTLSRSGSTS